jgi:hypothetical protein
MAVIKKPRSNSYGIVDATSDLALLNGRDNYQVQVKDVGMFEWLPTGTPNAVDIFSAISGVWSKVANSSEPKYKVYTALLTQSGGDDGQSLYGSGTLTIGVTYKIESNDSNTADFTNVGAPNNNDNTYFVATGTTPNSWGANSEGQLIYNTGAPAVTVLENTIGNIWFTYSDVGTYYANSTNLFTENKTWAVINTPNNNSNQVVLNIGRINNNECIIYSARLTSPFGQFIDIDTNGDEISIEIRVYN